VNKPMTRSAVLTKVAVLCLASAMVITGCYPGPVLPEKEPNDDFGHAQAFNISGTSGGRVAASLSDYLDLDVFQLGSLDEGQIISVYFRTDGCDRENDVVIALFDADGELTRLSTESGCAVIKLAVFSHEVLKAGQYDLAIAFSEDSPGGTLDYVLEFSLASSDDPFGPSGQLVYLNFDGASDIWLGSEHWADLDPFSNTFGTDRAEVLAEIILQAVRHDYQGLDIDIRSSYHTPAPSQEHTTIYIAGTFGDYLGLAEMVDWYNESATDVAIIFGNNFNHASWSDTQIAQAIGNVVSHEIGHLLGLVHTDDDTELMDEVTPNSLLRSDQDFHRAALADFPIGYQDAMDLLELILGIL